MMMMMTTTTKNNVGHTNNLYIIIATGYIERRRWRYVAAQRGTLFSGRGYCYVARELMFGGTIFLSSIRRPLIAKVNVGSQVIVELSISQHVRY
jgi:hypothetical protein